MRNRGAFPQVQILVRKVTTIADKGHEPHQVRPFLMRKNTTIDVDAKVHPAKAW